MPKYNIEAKQMNYYKFEIEANSQDEAIEEVYRIQNFGNENEHIETWDGLEIISVGKDEE
jgi:hypothetical protein